MADVHDPATRSYNMSQIKGKHTKPEVLVRKFLFAQGFRFRLHDKKLPGKPDIVLRKYKTVIFVNGCFWHGHQECKIRIKKLNLFAMLRVTCAVLIEKGLIFCAQRSESMPLPLKWEFPGGKIESNETEEACLIREIKEELSISIRVVERLTPNIHRISDDKIIELIPFFCERVNKGEIFLKEHLAGKWVEKGELHLLDWADADVAIVEEIQKIL